MVIVPKTEIGMNPKEFIGKAVMFEIEQVTANERTSKGGKKYADYTLSLLGAINDVAGDFRMNYLFALDLKPLIDVWGEDTDKWLGKKVDVGAKKDGEYSRWLLMPVENVK